MDITCENCQSKFKIPDETIPRGKTATLPCPKCKNTISIKAPETINAATEDDADSVAEEYGFEEDGYDRSEKPLSEPSLNIYTASIFILKTCTQANGQEPCF